MQGKAKKLEPRKLSDLLPFPLQQQYFGTLSEEKMAALADSIQSNGLKHPIEVLPVNTAGYEPNTIIHGHKRRAALELLGMKKVNVLVRYDLSEASRCVIELDFLGENHNRGQEDPLTEARIALHLLELERRRDGLQVQSGEARDRVGKVLGMSGRNLDRYLRVLTTPLGVQNAFRAGKITLLNAGKIAGLPKPRQQEIAARLDAGEEPRRFLKEYIGGGTSVTLAEYTSRFATQSSRLKHVLNAAAAEGIDKVTLDRLDATCRGMLALIAEHRRGGRKK
jgi:ParB/RepB/Spo0J family partition protein